MNEDDDFPRLTYNMPKPIIVGKDGNGNILKYGYGVLGVGSMWTIPTPEELESETYKAAPVWCGFCQGECKKNHYISPSTDGY